MATRSTSPGGIGGRRSGIRESASSTSSRGAWSRHTSCLIDLRRWARSTMRSGSSHSRSHPTEATRYSARVSSRRRSRCRGVCSRSRTGGSQPSRRFPTTTMPSACRAATARQPRTGQPTPPTSSSVRTPTPSAGLPSTAANSARSSWILGACPAKSALGARTSSTGGGVGSTTGIPRAGPSPGCPPGVLQT